jgi:uncharacterized membrane protein YoaK (UPF0700 family)
MDERADTPETPHRDRRVAVVLGLALIAGLVDAVSFLGLGTVFTANMTGNVILLGLAVGEWSGAQALRAGIAFVGFAAGLLLCGLILRRGLRRHVTIALSVEALLLAVFAGWWVVSGGQLEHAERLVLIGIAGIAMGVQSAAGLAIALYRMPTTYVSGTLADLIRDTVHHAALPPAWPTRAGVILAVGGGAAIGAALLGAWRAGAPLLALVGALMVLAIWGLGPGREEGPAARPR